MCSCLADGLGIAFPVKDFYFGIVLEREIFKGPRGVNCFSQFFQNRYFDPLIDSGSCFLSLGMFLEETREVNPSFDLASSCLVLLHVFV